MPSSWAADYSLDFGDGNEVVMVATKYFLPLTTAQKWEIGQMLQYPYVGFNPVNPIADTNAAIAAGTLFMDRYTPHDFNQSSAPDQFQIFFDKPSTLTFPGAALAAGTITGVTGAGGAHADNSSTPDTVLTVAMSLAGTNAVAGDLLRLFDAGVQTGADHTVTAGEITAVSASAVTAALAVSGTAHTLTAKLVRAGVPGPVSSNIWHITVTASGSSVTWDPAVKNPNIVLSNGNLTVTAGVFVGPQSNYATGSITAGQKKVWQITVVTEQGGGPGICIANASEGISDGNFMGQTANSMARYGDGTVVNNGGNIRTGWPLAVAGTVLGCAVDFDAGKVWFWDSVSGLWNNDVIGNQNPATGTGGIVHGITGPIFPTSTANSNGTIVSSGTAKFSSPYTFTTPAGFTQMP